MSTLSREQFVNQVLELVSKKFPLVKISRAPQRFSINVNGQLAPLENLYRIALLQPEQTPHHVQRWIVELLRAAEAAPQTFGSFQQVESRLMPMLLNDAEGHSVAAVSQPLVDGLAVAYALDGDRTISYLTPQRLTDWDQSIDQIHATALGNLLARSQSLSGQAAQDSRGRVYLILLQTMDGYDASRLLLPNLHEKLRGHLGSPFAAAVPNRDILLCFRDEERTIAQLQPQIQSDFRQMPHQISDRIFLLTPDGIAPRL